MLSKSEVKRIAGLELNAFNFARILPDALEGGRIRTTGTPVYDINGTLLFRRFPIADEKSRAAGYTDVAANEAMGAALLATSTGAEWNEQKIRKEAVAAAQKSHEGLKFDKIRFVAYSYPKIALQFLLNGKEVLMLEWKSWAKVPPAARFNRAAMQPSNFERWSLLDEMPKDIKRSNIRKFKKRLKLWDTRRVRRIDPVTIRRASFETIRPILRFFDSREVHYSPRTADHHPCFELRGQQTRVWCVGASVEMLLNFYRYQYNQVRLAKELGLGTCEKYNGLPYTQVAKVVKVIEKLSSGTLNATMHRKPSWKLFRNEIKANRPLISFIPGHSRVVAGYTQSLIRLPGRLRLPFKGLLVYDPWPNTDCRHPEDGGVITRWENFATQTYQYAYSAVLRHV